MLQGKKEQWMKWWLYNRFRYLDSKYVTGTSMTNRITIRTHEQENIWLTAYANIYGRVYYNDEVAVHRMERNKAYEFEWKASGAEDTVIGINDADMMTSLGDLAPLKPELVDVSKAIHLTSLKLGDGAGNYSNPSLNNVTFGNNILLRTIDVRNCPNLTQAVDISGCTNVEEVYFDGTSITGLKLPNGGILKTLKLPGTMTNLTLRNQKELTTFSMPSFTNVSTLRLENNSDVIDPLAIFNGMPANSRVRIIGFNKEMTNAELLAFIQKLDTMRGLDEEGNNTDLAQISGTIHVEEITPAEYRVINEAQQKYPDLKVTYDVLVPYTVRFFNYDGTLLETVTVEMEGAEAVYTGETPEKGENWEFIGWEPDPTNVTGNMDCYAVFYYNVSDMVRNHLEVIGYKTVNVGFNLSIKLTVNKLFLETDAPRVFSLKIIDKTSPMLDAESLRRDPTVRGEFYRLLEKDLLSDDEKTRSTAAAALRAGLAALAGEAGEVEMVDGHDDEVEPVKIRGGDADGTVLRDVRLAAEQEADSLALRQCAPA
jgi:hypothetical protein